jgi:hypothetical protein
VNRRISRGLRSMLLAATVLVAACDQDPFGAAQRPVVGRVSLEVFELDSYYLHVPESTDAPGGQLKGQVRQLAWDSTTILVERDSDYVVVDVGSGWVRGPLTLASAQQEPLFARLAPASYVWHRLPRF